jgi:uncharacterized protein (TIRG00374 family)
MNEKEQLNHPQPVNFQAVRQFLRRYRNLLLNLLKIVVSVGLLVLIFTKIDLQELWQALQQANRWWLVAAVIVMTIGVVVRAFRWRILLEAIGISVPISELTKLYFISFLFNNLLPSGLGGDPIRMMELNRHSERGSDAVTSVVVDRFLGLSALQAIAVVALLTNWGVVPNAVAYYTIGIFVGGLAGGYLLINRPLYLNLRRRLKPFHRLTDIKFIGNLFESFQSYPPSSLGRSYLVSFLFNVTHLTMYAFIGWALSAPVSLIQFAIIVPITSILLLLPSLPGGLGVREGGFLLLYTQIGVSEEVAVAMSLLVYVIGNVYTGLIGAIIYLWRSAQGVVLEKDQSINKKTISSDSA